MAGKAWLIGPIVVGVILCSSLFSVGRLLYEAHADPNFAVEPDYYGQALRWDETAAQRAENERLGWTVTDVSSSIEGAGASRYVSMLIALRDADGAAVEGAMVDFVAFHNARAKARQRVEGVAAEYGEPGVYRVSFAGELAGTYQLRLRAELADGTVFTHRGPVDVVKAD